MDQDGLRRMLATIPGYVPGTPLPAPPVAEMAKRAAQSARERIAPAGERCWLPFAAMPSDMCRCSPFFPISRAEMSTRTYIEDLLIAKSSWGSITYTGPKLSIHDEDVLIALMVMIELSGDKRCTFSGPVLPILKLLGYDNPGSNHYKMLYKSLKRMASSVFEMNIKDESITIENIITHIELPKDKSKINIVLNPFFYEKYVKGNVTYLDILTRRKLKKSVSKALYRFIASQRKGWRGHWLTLAHALNLETDQAAKEVRRQLREAVAELRRCGVLTRGSGFSRREVDVVALNLAERKPEVP